MSKYLKHVKSVRGSLDIEARRYNDDLPFKYHCDLREIRVCAPNIFCPLCTYTVRFENCFKLY